MATLFMNIKALVNVRERSSLLRGAALKQLPCIDDAYLVVEGKTITEYGTMRDCRYKGSDFTEHHDLSGQYILPSWCDSHTHLVFGGSRESEFVDKIKGFTYESIAAKGGGILASARRLGNMSEDELFSESLPRLHEVIRNGTGAIEIKSGYGLTVESELKILRVIRRLRQAVNIPVKATFLGAHALPAAFKDDREGYISLIIDEMLPAIAREQLAQYIDVFCEKGFYTPEETERICIAGRHFGLKPKIHANQLHVSGGVQAGVRCGAVSVDHLECMDEDAIRVLAASNTMGTLLPTAAFFLRMPFQPARTLIDAGCAIALASDYNPGSSPSGNMNFVVSLSCIQMKMLPEEAINAATINGAFAMESDHEVGSITRGKLANLILTKKIPSLNYLPYSFGTSSIDRVMVAGDWIY
ncbi:MAG TPA: imidazolonepropionase [Flavisolibacter sp.]